MARDNETNDRNFRITNHNAIDVHVGSRIRKRRTLLGMSQEQLGRALEITFQQVQKYERGANRVSASRLWDISQILDVDIGYFFEDMTKETRSLSPRRVSSGVAATRESQQEADPMARRETLELVRSYYSIEDRQFRRQISGMVKSFAMMINNPNRQDND
ncbi:MAG: helix-turn-helix domain-containing protein [Candidatus Puniceispirillales bacterium]